MQPTQRKSNIFFALFVALSGWCIPGSGFFLLNEKKRSVIISVTICLTFAVGLYVGSVAVIDPVNEKLWYVAQMLNSPFVALLGRITAANHLQVFGKPAEIGQLYTGISGMLNLLCIINATYLAYTNLPLSDGGKEE
jgi:hypothetical protein